MTADTTHLPLPVNHVFVDFENVHEVDLAIFTRKAVNLTLLLGARQTRLDVGLVEKLLEHASSVQLVRLASSGTNALDFTLAYYVGRAAVADPAGHFHIVSKDTGFDPLIEHLKTQHIHIRRHDDFAALTSSGPAKAPGVAPECLESRILTHLRKHTTARPKRQATLVTHLSACFGKTATRAEIENVIGNLIKAGQLIVGEKGLLTYSL